MTHSIQRQACDEALFHLPNEQVRRKSCSLVSASWFLNALAPSIVPPALCELVVQCCFPTPGISLGRSFSRMGTIEGPLFLGTVLSAPARQFVLV